MLLKFPLINLLPIISLRYLYRLALFSFSLVFLYFVFHEVSTLESRFSCIHWTWSDHFPNVLIGNSLQPRPSCCPPLKIHFYGCQDFLCFDFQLPYLTTIRDYIFNYCTANLSLNFFSYMSRDTYHSVLFLKAIFFLLTQFYLLWPRLRFHRLLCSYLNIYSYRTIECFVHHQALDSAYFSANAHISVLSRLTSGSHFL